ncbi:serine hydrolase domain-containing protein [Aspergillus fijiensis CBS 313.89]|uniref:Beta-lactamase/transpeptidase-like protein n=1 Tax=Aspergillus fijiensis CBS 313.89 TaxID=1448319 RepID=A0A8G1RZW4_9EURO|nr:beta-lactamase/transpeptidase-like protein [Aspergillus fijiensis CBS 313.89]RAK81929.1 beta-lactamase/transpeptidase-like protein [Aspergillus fijiensis CBS 313.89]
MRHSTQSIILFSSLALVATADRLGPIYPAPVDLSSSHSHVRAVWENLTTTIDDYLKHPSKNGSTTLLGIENITFSAGLFSVHDPEAKKLQYHWTSPEIAESTNGTRKVDGDSIFRIASVSKLFTTYAGMLSLAEGQWDLPLSKIYPGFAKYAAEAIDAPAWSINWDEITPWALASQSSGIPTQGGPLMDLLWQYVTGQSTVSPITAYGLPPENTSSLGPCYGSLEEALELCDGTNVIDSMGSRPPTFKPWWTPMYSDANFEMLALMISNITGKSISEIYQTEVFDSLNLSSTFSSPPTSNVTQARAVVAGPAAAGFYLEIPFTTPSGGIYSSTNDLATFGVSILNHTLLPETTTRKWMKPQTHTASLTASIGAPWEIVRVVSPTTGRVTDIYTKLGDSGYYGGIVALIPDYDAGFSILAASTSDQRSALTNVILDYITLSVLPALEAQAALEAAQNLVGTYVSEDPSLNSSVTIATDDSVGSSSYFHGLRLTQWISNNTDLLASPYLSGYKPRLLLSIPKSTPRGVAGEVAFQVSRFPQTYSYFASNAADLGVIGPFTGQYNTNLDFWSTDTIYYGTRGLGTFVFTVDGDGKASAISPTAAKIKLERKT